MQTSYLLGVCYTYLAGGGWLANSKYNMILKVIPLFNREQSSARVMGFDFLLMLYVCSTFVVLQK